LESKFQVWALFKVIPEAQQGVEMQPLPNVYDELQSQPATGRSNRNKTGHCRKRQKTGRAH